MGEGQNSNIVEKTLGNQQNEYKSSQKHGNPVGFGEKENIQILVLTKNVLVAKQESHSVVWNFFSFKHGDDKSQKYILCKKFPSAPPQGNTTNSNHLGTKY